MEAKQCTTCGANLEAEDSFAIFPCPGCQEEKIARCESCKEMGNDYECEECGFTGP